jgi:hypothetical protein
LALGAWRLALGVISPLLPYVSRSTSTPATTTGRSPLAATGATGVPVLINSRDRAADEPRVTVLKVSRWTRFGKDRLYVSTDQGDRVGWLDLITGQTILERPEFAEPFRVALASHVGQPSSPAVPPPLPPVPPTWVDLAMNQSGQGTRERADDELAAMRERSRVGAFLSRTFDLKTDERAWRVGADGEESVGASLDKLRSHGWRVLHSVPVGRRGSDIDHVLIGPGGVFTVNTKNHPGATVWVGRDTIRVNGRATPYVHKSRFEAERACRRLTDAVGRPVEVRAAVVLLTGTWVPNVTVTQQPEGVLVLDRMDIPSVFKRARDRLSPTDVEAVYDHARRSTTWT